MRPAAFILSLAAAALTAAPAPLTIDQLIDIRHPSNPVWSRDSRRIAFTWERAGVANLYIVPADGSSAAVQVTADGVPAGYFWSADSHAIEFFRGGALMAIPASGGPVKTVTSIAGRSPAISRDGTRVAYVAGNDIHVRALAGGADSVVATVPQPVTTVTWINDSTLGLASGGGGETIRHEQTPDYSGSKIIYTITERRAGPPAETWMLPLGGGAPVKYSAGGGGFGGRGGSRWIDATHFLIDRQSPDYKRRRLFVG
jgi:dipeptidyl aminopeptidase/acylaminoacyl peptidase